MKLIISKQVLIEKKILLLRAVSLEIAQVREVKPFRKIPAGVN